MSPADKLIHGAESIPVVDAIATVDASGAKWAVALLNRHPDREVACTIKLKDKPLDGTYQAEVLAGDSPEAFNEIEHPGRVVPENKELKFTNGVALLGAHSLSIVHVALD